MRAFVSFFCGLICLADCHCPDISLNDIGNADIAFLMYPGVYSMSQLWGVGKRGTMTGFSLLLCLCQVGYLRTCWKGEKKIVVELCHDNWWKGGSVETDPELISVVEYLFG